MKRINRKNLLLNKYFEMADDNGRLLDVNSLALVVVAAIPLIITAAWVLGVTYKLAF